VPRNPGLEGTIPLGLPIGRTWRIDRLKAGLQPFALDSLLTLDQVFRFHDAMRLKGDWFVVLLSIALPCGVFGEQPPQRRNAEADAIQAQYDAKVKQEVQQPYEAGVVGVRTKYVADLQAMLETAQRAGKLEDVLAMKKEMEAIALGRSVPANDDPVIPASLKQLRESYRDSLARLDAERAQRLRPLQASFVKSLDGMIARLTKEGSFDEAVAVKKQRDAVGTTAPEVEPPRLAGLGRPPPLLTKAQLIAKPWRYEVPTDKQAPGIFTFNADKTLSSTKSGRGTWQMRDKILRVHIASSDFWAELSLEFESSKSGIVLNEVISSRGRRPNAMLIQGP